MKKVLLALFIFAAFTCAAQTQKDSVIIEENELTALREMSEEIGIYIDSVAYSGTQSETNAAILATAANIPREWVKFAARDKNRVIVYFRKEIMIGG